MRIKFCEDMTFDDSFGKRTYRTGEELTVDAVSNIPQTGLIACRWVETVISPTSPTGRSDRFDRIFSLSPEDARKVTVELDP